MEVAGLAPRCSAWRGSTSAPSSSGPEQPRSGLRRCCSGLRGRRSAEAAGVSAGELRGLGEAMGAVNALPYFRKAQHLLFHQLGYASALFSKTGAP